VKPDWYKEAEFTFIKLLVAIAIIGILAALLLPALQMAKGHAKSVACVRQMCAFSIAARSWADEAGGRFPSNITYLRDYMGPSLLICPGDRGHRAASTWSTVTSEASSYEIIAPGISETDTNTPFLRCKFHHYTAYSDGTTFDGIRRRHKYD
jgi:type II secretory pathway pseudopilin PulG